MVARWDDFVYKAKIKQLSLTGFDVVEQEVKLVVPGEVCDPYSQRRPNFVT